MLSFVIPFVDEEPTLAELCERIAAVVRPTGEPFEVILVDDGSRDGGAARAAELAAARPGEVKLIELRGNFGKSAALAAGFEHATGGVVFTLDADLQDDPKEIPRFLEALRGGLDVVSGYKQTRHDPWHKVIPSRVFNWLVRQLTGVRLHDINCGFKCYRAEVLRDVRVYGELHRFIPALAAWNRYRVGEISVEHHPRRFGTSKFGVGRFFRGLMDLLTVTFLVTYDRKPLHFFGWLGGVCFLAGLAICGYLTAIWCAGASIGQRPLLTLGVLLIVIGVQTLATGLLAELIVHVQGDSRPYRIRRTIGFPPSTGQPDGRLEQPDR
jgi:glycosyltransferase involved in cell wall biosynthesis